MELEELKSNWLKMNQQLKKQKHITNELIMKMILQRSNSIFRSVINFEKLGIATSSFMLLFIFSNVGKLDDWLSLAGGISTSVILVFGLVMSLFLIKKIQNVDFATKSYRQTISDVNKIKKIQYYMKWSSAFLAPILVASILPTLAATWFDKSLLYDLEEYWSSLIPCLFLIPIVWYFTGKFYVRRIKELNELLKEVNQ